MVRAAHGGISVLLYIFGMLLAVLASAGLIPTIFEPGRIELLLSKPVNRSHILLGRYLGNLEAECQRRGVGARLRVLRSDGGLMGFETARDAPVNLLMSGPAGGVAGALWAGRRAGFENLLTFDMGGTSTDVALIEAGRARLRRETAVGDVVVRASSLDDGPRGVEAECHAPAALA